MSRERAVNFLFAIVNEVKLSYECPVVLLTRRDYADDVYKILGDLRRSLQDNESAEVIINIITSFNFAWLEAVQEVDFWKKRVKDTPRETIIKAVDYTIVSIKHRHRRFEKFLDHTIKLLTQTEKELLDAETDVIRDLRDINISALEDKQKCLSNSVDRTEFFVLVSDETNELLNWIDKLSNSLALQICKILELKHLPKELIKNLDEIIARMSKNLKESSSLQVGRSRLSITSTVMENEICKINTKIKKLRERISIMKNDKPSATNTLALQHKTIFLQDRLESLENLKTSIACFKKKESDQSEEGHVSALDNPNIFNHLLPQDYRCQLVHNLVESWDNAINSLHVKSLISVMRAAEAVEEYTDEFGTFTVDEHGRKIYRSKSDNTLYQLDGTNTLVPVKDDKGHVYFYDALGRYYLTDDKLRVYKAHSHASEYMLHSSGKLLKLQETVEGVVYRYDTLGRYYVSDEGYRIYREADSPDEYKHDGLGNLVRIRDEDQAYFTYCPTGPMVTAESLYLKKTVGEALKKCVAEVCMVAPDDPVKFLAGRLMKYHYNMVLKEENRLKEKELQAERERLRLEREKALLESAPEESVYEETTWEDRSTTDQNYESYVGSNL